MRTKLISIITTYVPIIPVSRKAIFLRNLDNLHEECRKSVFDGLMERIVPDVVIVARRGDVSGVFDHLAEDGSADIGIYISEMHEGRRYRMVHPFVVKKNHYILSPLIPLPKNWISGQYEYVELNLIGFLTKRTVSTYLEIYDCLSDNLDNCPVHWNRDGIVYSREMHGDFMITEMKTSMLGAIINTVYRGRNIFIDDLSSLIQKMESQIQKGMNKSKWSTMAVDELLKIFESRGLTDTLIDLSQYPDIVSVLFPISFCDMENMRWTSTGTISLGFNLRNVQRSRFEHLFKMDEVNRLCQAEGVYYTTKIYSIIN
jgi:hypothetical protein